MTNPLELQIQPGMPGVALTPTQARFNALVAEVALWRAALAGWNESMAHYHDAVEPVRRQVHAAGRQWVFALDIASLQPGFSRGERMQLVELLVEAAEGLLVGEQDDAEIACVLERHAAEVRGGGAAGVASPVAALALSALEVDAVPEDALLEDLATQWEQQAAAAAAMREQRAANRRAAGLRQRQKREASEVSQSLRDVYRSLASALHPDREPDADERRRKTVRMQQANQAYEDGNLLALLELQAQAVEVRKAQGTDDRRLRDYIALLEGQLAELQRATHRVEGDFRAAVGAAPGSGLQRRKRERLVSAEVQRLRDDLQHLLRQARLPQEVDATKEWLRALRRA